MENVSTILLTTNYSRAQLIKKRLELENIECYLKNVNLIQPDISTGVKILINKNDLEKASKIIEDIDKDKHSMKKEVKDQKIKKIRKILVPVDFSVYSIVACEYALDMAIKFGAEIKLFHAYYNPAINVQPIEDVYSYNISMSNYVENIEKEARKNINKLKKKLITILSKRKIEKLKITASLSCGNAEDEIINISEKYKPDIIIIGAKKESGKMNYIIGNVAAKIIERAKMPVLMISENSQLKDIEEINNVLYATNFDKSDFKAIKKLIKIIQPFNYKVYCLHIITDTQNPNPWDKIKMEKLNKHIKKRYSDYNIECDMIINKDVLTGIEEFTKRKNIDIISMTTHKRNFFEKIFSPSLTKKMIFQTYRPLLIFHSE